MVILINQLISNTPMLLRHGAAWMLALTGYMVFLVMYESLTGLQVYPFVSVAQPLLVIAAGGVVYAGLVAIWTARELLLLKCTGRDSEIWYNPPSAEEIQRLQKALAVTGI